MTRRSRAASAHRSFHVVLFTLIAIYAVAFLHGVARSSCDCPEPPDSVLVPASVDPSTFTRCVLYDPPTRARLHSRLAQCVGLTRWKIPPLPQQQPAPWEGGGAAWKGATPWEGGEEAPDWDWERGAAPSWADEGVLGEEDVGAEGRTKASLPSRRRVVDGGGGRPRVVGGVGGDLDADLARMRADAQAAAARIVDGDFSRPPPPPRRPPPRPPPPPCLPARPPPPTVRRRCG